MSDVTFRPALTVPSGATIPGALRAGAAPGAWPFLFTKPRGRNLLAAMPTAAGIYRLIEASCLLGALGLSFGLLAAFLWMGL